MNITRFLIIGCICLLSISAISCAGVESYSEENIIGDIRLVAVMPIGGVINNQTEVNAIRARFIDELYFRGYPKIPISIIDETITAYKEKETNKKTYASNWKWRIPPQELREKLGVDAVMYININTAEQDIGNFSASYLLTLTFQVIDARTGKELLKRDYESSGWMPGVSNIRMKIENVEKYGKSLSEMIRNAVSTMPVGKGF